MGNFDVVPWDEVQRLDWHLAEIAVANDKPGKSAYEVRSAAIQFSEKYCAGPGDMKRYDAGQIKEFIENHGRNPNEPIPTIALAQSSPTSVNDWISVAEQPPVLPDKATHIKVEVRHFVGADVVESPALFVNEQSGYNPFKVPFGTPVDASASKTCFVLIGQNVDKNGSHIVTEYVEPTHWRPRNA